MAMVAATVMVAVMVMAAVTAMQGMDMLGMGMLGTGTSEPRSWPSEPLAWAQWSLA